MAIDQADLGHTAGSEKHERNAGSWLSGLPERNAYAIPASLWSNDAADDQQVMEKSSTQALCFRLPTSSFASDLLTQLNSATA